MEAQAQYLERICLFLFEVVQSSMIKCLISLKQGKLEEAYIRGGGGGVLIIVCILGFRGRWAYNRERGGGERVIRGGADKR